MVSAGEKISAFFKVGPIRTDAERTRGGVSQIPAGERRTSRNPVLHAFARLIEKMAPQGKRTQERLEMKAAAAQMKPLIGAMASGHNSTAERAVHKLAYALNTLTQNPTELRDAALKLFEASLSEVVGLTDDELTTLDAGLTELLKKPKTAGPEFQQLSVSVKSLLLNREIKALGLSEEGSWSVTSTSMSSASPRPTSMSRLSPEQLLRYKNLLDHANAIHDKTLVNSNGHEVPSVSSYTNAKLDEICQFGRSASAQLKTLAKQLVANASTHGALGVMPLDKLKTLKVAIDFLMEDEKNTPNQVHVLLQADVTKQIQASEDELVEHMLGKGNFDAHKLVDAKIGKLAEAIDALKDKPPALAVARKAIRTEMDVRMNNAKTEFQTALRAAVRKANGSAAALALKNYVTQAQAATDVCSALRVPMVTTEITQWITGVLVQERALGVLGESSLKKLRESLTKNGTGSTSQETSPRESSPSTEHLSRLREALNAMYAAPPRKDTL